MNQGKIQKTIIMLGSVIVLLMLFGWNQAAYAGEEDWPMMMPGSSWFALGVNKINIKTIEFMDSYVPNGTEVKVCNVDLKGKGEIKAYLLSGRRNIIIAGNGSGGIMANPDCSKMFMDFQTLCEVRGMEFFCCKKTTNTEYMFMDCFVLEEIDVNTFKSAKLIHTDYMFQNCCCLKEINTAGWDLEELMTASYMFDNCAEIKTLYFKRMSGTQLRDISYMFRNCYELTTINVDNIKTDNVINMAGVFQNCVGLERLDLNDWLTGNVTNMQSLFSGCTGLKSLNLRNMDTGKVLDLSGMFRDCTGLKSLDIQNFNISFAKSLNSMFDGCILLENINNSFSASSVTSTENMFRDCISLKSLDVSGIRGYQLSSVNGMFDGCSGLEELNLGMNLGNVLQSSQNGIFGNDTFPVLKKLTIPREVMITISLPETGSGHFEFQGEEITTIPMNLSSTETLTVQHRITYLDLEDNSVLNETMLNRGEKEAAPDQPSKLSPAYTYQFTGWVDVNGQPFDFTKEVYSDQLIYASWKKDEIRYQVSFDPCNGAPVATCSVAYKGRIKESEAPVKITMQSEFRFLGWFLNGEVYDFDSEILSNITLLAHWEEVSGKKKDPEEVSEETDKAEEKQKEDWKEEKKEEQKKERKEEQKEVWKEEQKEEQESVKITQDSTEKKVESTSSDQTAKNSSAQDAGSSSKGGSSGGSGGGSGGGSSGGSSGGGSGGGGSYVSNGRTPSGPKITIAGSTSTYSSFWYTDSNGNWRIRGKNGKMITSCWLCDDAVTSNGKEVWYLIGTNGEMLSCGLVQDNTGNYYSLEMTHNGYYGMLRYKNGFYRCGNETLYITFEHSHNGSFGAITNAEALEALKKQYGITRFPIGNENCIYTSTF